MAFYFRANEDVEDGIRRIVSEQIDKAIAEIDDRELDRHEAVHQVRKRCKKIRGVLRLARPALGKTFSRENALFRDAARDLSYARDAEAIIETVDDLVSTFKKQVERKAFTSVRRVLTERRRRIAEDRAAIEKKLVEFRQRMCEAKDRLKDWKLKTEEFDAIGPGLTKTYRRGRKAMARALKNPTVENYHEWRKRAKYHWYHCRLLQRIWKPVMREIRNEAKKLSDLLGDDHNLAVLRKTLLDSADEFGSKRTLQTLLALIDRRSAELRTKAETLGKRVHADKPKQLGARFRKCWNAWKEEKQKPAAKLNRNPAATTK